MKRTKMIDFVNIILLIISVLLLLLLSVSLVFDHMLNIRSAIVSVAATFMSKLLKNICT